MHTSKNALYHVQNFAGKRFLLSALMILCKGWKQLLLERLESQRCVRSIVCIMQRYKAMQMKTTCGLGGCISVMVPWGGRKFSSRICCFSFSAMCVYFFIYWNGLIWKSLAGRNESNLILYSLGRVRLFIDQYIFFVTTQWHLMGGMSSSRCRYPLILPCPSACPLALSSRVTNSSTTARQFDRDYLVRAGAKRPRTRISRRPKIQLASAVVVVMIAFSRLAKYCWCLRSRE